jgi:oxaloacetate decarboxylase alpha subunit
MNLKEIREVINLMNENELTEIEIEREGMKVKIKKAAAEGFVPVYKQPTQYHVETQGAPQKIDSAPAANPNRKEIKSPMVGTFYRSPSPDAPVYTEVGQIVEIGQVVCIVEAMKLMNEIKSEIRGKVVEVAVENAQPIEFGQVLFALEPV